MKWAQIQLEIEKLVVLLNRSLRQNGEVELDGVNVQDSITPGLGF